MNHKDYFLALLRASLWQKPITGGVIAPPVCRCMIAAAKKQTVLGLLSDALLAPENGFQLDRQTVIGLLVAQQTIAKQNQRANQVLVELCELLRAHAIEFIVVKGQLLAQYYPHPQHRQSGDIDFYCDARNFVRAKEVIQSAWGVTFSAEDDESEQHIAFDYKDVPFELHFCLLKFCSERVQMAFDKMLNEAQPFSIDVAGCAVPTLPPVENLIFTFLHLYHHFVELGIGLRQLCDMALLIHAHASLLSQPEYARRLQQLLQRLDFLPGFNAFGAVCVQALGLPKADYPFQLSSSDEAYIKDILHVVFARGNFGMHGRKHAVRSGLAYYVETMKIKLYHYMRFYRLSPTENRAVLWRGLPQKIVAAFKR